MTCRSALELLLPELQRRVLLHLDSFGTLYALTRASPRMYQVFRLNRKTILSEVTCRQFDRATISTALAFEELCQIEQPPFSRDTVLQFYTSAVFNQGDCHDPILPLPVSTKLAKLDGALRFFTDDYAQNTLPIVLQLNMSERPPIKAEYKPDCSAPKPTISRSESNRLRRAFCRFETYRQLFSRCSSNLDHKSRRCPRVPPLTIYEQAERFFQNMPAYQAAEIACVRDYLHRRLRGVFDQVEDEIVQELQAGLPNPSNKHQGLEWDYWANGGRHQYLAREEHYFGYSGKDDQSYHIEYLSSLGLPYIRNLLKSASDERRNLLLRTGAGCHTQNDTDFITAALGLDAFTSYDEIYGSKDRGIDCCLDEKGKADLPSGWLWAHSDGHYQGVVDFYAKGLRDWGYVFWDRERLQKAGVLNLNPYKVRLIGFDDYLAGERPSVQERWFGPRTPLSEDEDDQEDEEEEKVEEVVEEEGPEHDDVGGSDQGQVEGQEHEDMHDKTASHELSTCLSLIPPWSRDCGQDWWKPCEAKRTAIL